MNAAASNKFRLSVPPLSSSKNISSKFSTFSVNSRLYNFFFFEELSDNVILKQDPYGCPMIGEMSRESRPVKSNVKIKCRRQKKHSLLSESCGLAVEHSAYNQKVVG